MKSEADIWIETLTTAIENRGRLPVMSVCDHREIIMLMRSAGRHDLASMAQHVIPIDWSGARRLSLRDFMRKQEAHGDASAEADAAP